MLQRHRNKTKEALKVKEINDIFAFTVRETNQHKRTCKLSATLKRQKLNDNSVQANLEGIG